MAEGKIPVDFEKKVKQAAAPNGLGSPVQISARDLMENFNYLLDLIPTLEATTATAVVIGDTFKLVIERGNYQQDEDKFIYWNPLDTATIYYVDGLAYLDEPTDFPIDADIRYATHIASA